MIRAVVFDFDGVILDSNWIKISAYAEVVKKLFPGNDDLVNAIGITEKPVPRSVSMSILARELAARFVISQHEIDAVASSMVYEYGVWVDKEMESAPFIDGALDAIRTLANNYALYINTLNPANKIGPVLKARGIADSFVEVFGSEKSKIENLRGLTQAYLPREIAVVGDGVLDWDSARTNKTHFIAVNLQGLDMSSYPPVAEVTNLLPIVEIVRSL